MKSLTAPSVPHALRVDHVRPAGRRALLIDCADDAAVAAWRAELWRWRDAGELSVVDIVAGARSVLLDGLDDPAATAQRLAGRPAPPPVATDRSRTVEVPVEFNGPDLGDVARRWGVPEAAVVERLTQTELRVAFCGFAPGFGYLTGLPAELAVPRLAEPRPRVPAGAVGLAAGYAGIYPTASPGGWRLVGRTGLRLFDPERRPPAVLEPGVAVRLVVR